MLCTLDLTPMPLVDVAIVDGGALAAMRVVGATPRVALVASDGRAFALAPGGYVFELELRGGGGRPTPGLVWTAADGRARESALAPQSAFAWRAELSFAQTVIGLALALDGLDGAFIVARCRIATQGPEPAPRLRDAFVQGARALYHKAPATLRRAVTLLAVRAPRFARWRAANVVAAETAGGGIRLAASEGATAELEVRRADFDARFAVARGLREDVAALAAERVPGDARIVAFYLPQYHRIPENDAWWGAGFTEWTNVAKAVPQFIGHHQPRLPGELGFYDLTTPDVLRRQVELAKAHGVGAFCFHYYWFGGRRLLERPLDAFLADRSLDIGFALCWANENWTRRWDGAEHDILMAQQHSRDDHARVFDDIARYLEDARAIRIGGKPLIVVYRPALIADVREMTEIWRERAAARGWPGVYLAATDAFQFDAPAKLGFDGLIEFPPHGLSPPRIEKSLAWLNPSHRGAVFAYSATAEEAVARLARQRTRAHDVFPGVMPGWDNEARRPGAGNIFHGATPQAYARWLSAACEAAGRTLAADRRLVFINAWNEWAEGAYLEPDRKWGRAFLEATAQVAGASRAAP